jgi:peptidoglycan/xylan/chitin deacetylase (PgdA/CDA1 family)
MKAYLVKTPKIIQKMFSNYHWKIATSKKEIYLTFDDGPIPEITPWVLEQLKAYQAKATFFCVGDNVCKYPDVFNSVFQEDHSIGNHTFHHLNGWKTATHAYLENVEKCTVTIKKQQSKTIEISNLLFRPPHGRIKTSQTKYLLQKGYKIILWDVLSGDFEQSLSKESCLDHVLKNTQEGSIIVFHDSEKAFKNLEYVLPRILEHFSKKGFVFKALKN